ncbi:MAG: hypothetical protein ACM3PW_11830 [Chlamydiota bacterium]
MKYVQADFSVELGAEDPTLQIPWSSSDPRVQYYDLRSHPELLPQIVETRDNEALAEFLAVMNSPRSVLQSAKCDTWSSQQMDAEDEIFSAAVKYESYIDLAPVAEGPRYSFAEIEDWGRKIARLLQRAPEIPAAAEFVARRCYYQHEAEPAPGREGFYLTFYLSGYGDNQEQARERWSIALQLVANALLQLSAAESARARQ